MTTEQHQGAIRFKDPKATDPKKAAWVKVDLGMEAKSDGTAGPVGHPGGLSLAGKTAGAGKGAKASTGTDAFAVDEKSGRTVSLAWPGALPAPVLKGELATYPEVLPGVDFVVHSRRSGFESDVVIKTAAARDALVAKAGEAEVSFSFPLKTKGLTARAEKDGSVSFVDAKNKKVSSFAAPMAWDAEVDPTSGNRVNESPVAMTVTQKNAGNAVLTVTPNKGWLESAERVWPITIDPTYATGSNITTSFDTFVSTSWANSTTPQTMTELRVGTYDGGGDVARSYLNFPVSGIQGVDVVSAHLSLYEFHSFSCTAKPVYAYNSGAASTATTWGNQPTQYALAGSLTTAIGFSSSCAAGRISIPITPVVQGWTTTGNQNGSLKLSASETDSYGWKKFYSLESSSDPYIIYTYNRKPNAAAAPTVTGGVSYTPPGGTLATYTKETKPQLNVVATDPDLNGYTSTIEVHSSTTGSALLTSCATPTSPYTASGQKASCTIPTALTNNSQVYARAAVKDERGLWNGTWSPWTTMRVATTAPAAPVITCPAPYTNGFTTATVPAAAVACTVSAVGTSWSAPSVINVTYNGVTTPKAITPSSDPTVAKTTVTISNTAGTHSISAVASTPSLVSSQATAHSVIFGAATLTYPVDGASSTGTVPVRATMAKPAGTLTAKMQYRLAGDTTAAWVDGDTLTVNATGANAEISGGWNLTGITGTNISGRVPVTFQARVCLSTGSGCAATTTAVTITRLPNALGDGYPTDGSSGAGTVALFTGEFSTSASDVSIGGIGIGRSYESFNSDQTVNDTVRGVFGPGWTGSFGEVSGRAGWTINDTTHADGRISITSPDGSEVLTFARPDGAKSYSLASPPVVYVPSNDAAADAQVTLTLSGTASTAKLELREEEGTVTAWGPTAALPTTLPLTASATWAPSAVREPGDSTTAHTFYYPDPANPSRVGRIVDVPEGRSSTECPATGTWGAGARGCVRVDITYGTTNTAPEAAGQVKTITASLWNPGTSTMNNALPMAAYEYDALKRLVKVADQRTTPALATQYGWDGTSTRLSTITPPGLAPYRIFYDSTLGAERVKLVTRDSATAATYNAATAVTAPAGSVALARYVYGVTPAGNGTALPKLSATGVAPWYQATAPSTGFAVFGPNYAWNGSTTITAPAATSNEWRYAALSYTTTDGYTVNTGTFGAGAWRVAATDYDADGNVVRLLDPGATSTITISVEVEDPAKVNAMSTQTVYAPDGVVTDVFEPVHDAQTDWLNRQGLRRHTKNTYDEGAPNSNVNPDTGKPYRLVTSSAVYAYDTGGVDANLVDWALIGYSPVEAGDDSGWDTGRATSETKRQYFFADAANDITRVTRYDTQGRVIETRQPLATGTTHAGTTRTQYYTGSGTGTCAGKPEWAGLECRTYPGASPTGTIGDLPTKTFEYNQWGDVATVAESVGGATVRTTTITADPVGRPTSAVVDVVDTQIASSTARPGTTYGYAVATGLPSTIVRVGFTGTITQSYDGWGRPTVYTNDLGDIATTTYATSGAVQSITDPKGTLTYTVDGTDANGNEERRGLPTQLTVTRGGTAGNLTYTGAYDALGQLTVQTMPGALRQRNTYNEVGELTSMAYTGQVTPVTEGTDPETGETTWTPGPAEQDQPWLVWTRHNDLFGRVVQEFNGAGVAFDGIPGVTDPSDIDAPTVGNATAADKAYLYDHAGRLIRVLDRTATTPGTLASPDEPGSAALPCTSRQYTFDKNGNRTRLVTDHEEGDCWWAVNTTPVSDVTYNYDTADRPINGTNGTGTYTYDKLGRQTTLPAADAPNPAAGNITLGYYDDDLPHTITQAGVTTTYALDPANRRQTSTTGTANTVRHYTDTTDKPSWTVTDEGATRNTPSLAGGVGAQIGDTGETALSLANPHGDNVTTVQLPATTPATTTALNIASWHTYDEYGQSTDPSQPYGYLGQHERENTTESAGLTLMGVRPYNDKRGLFTSIDTVPGGNENAYAYPSDPFNMMDVSGMFSIKWGRWWGGSRVTIYFSRSDIGWATGFSGLTAFWRYVSWAAARRLAKKVVARLALASVPGLGQAIAAALAGVGFLSLFGILPAVRIWFWGPTRLAWAHGYFYKD